MGFPSTSARQQPHWPWGAQASLGEVILKVSRSNSSRDCPGRTSACLVSPFSWKEMVFKNDILFLWLPRRPPGNRGEGRACPPERRASHGTHPGPVRRPRHPPAPRAFREAGGLRPARPAVRPRRRGPGPVGVHPRPPGLEPARPRGGPAHPAGAEHRPVLAGRLPGHGAEDRPGEGRPRHPPALHRHADGGLQRRVVAGAAARAVARGVREGLDAHRAPEGLRPAPGNGARASGTPSST